MKRAVLTLVAAMTIAAACESSASAQGFGRFGGAGLGFGSTNIFDLFRSGVTPTPPYFALTPPVYYSYPVPRTYGFSPFYYPGDVQTPDPYAAAPEPKQILNPFVPYPASNSETAAEEATAQAAPASGGPLMVENPYFQRETDIYQVSH